MIDLLVFVLSAAAGGAAVALGGYLFGRDVGEAEGQEAVYGRLGDVLVTVEVHDRYDGWLIVSRMSLLDYLLGHDGVGSWSDEFTNAVRLSVGPQHE